MTGPEPPLQHRRAHLADEAPAMRDLMPPAAESRTVGGSNERFDGAVGH
ncbi:hypothetical protein [Spirillospora sp. NPDC048819]